MGAGDVSARFRGEQGEAYFALQHRLAEAGAALDMWKFRDLLCETDTLVDFGCGPGALLSLLPGSRKIGVEVNRPAREEAQRRGFETLASSSLLPDEVADVVISNHALEHTLHPFSELRELWRALKPGGKLVLWLPIDDWRSQRAHWDEPNNHLYTWTPLLLGNLLEEAGFSIESVRVATTAWRHDYVRLASLLPRRTYAALTFLTAVGLRRRQLVAVAWKPPQNQRSLSVRAT
jgi:SAM-dependent methyltransferase